MEQPVAEGLGRQGGDHFVAKGLGIITDDLRKGFSPLLGFPEHGGDIAAHLFLLGHGEVGAPEIAHHIGEDFLMFGGKQLFQPVILLQQLFGLLGHDSRSFPDLAAAGPRRW